MNDADLTADTVGAITSIQEISKGGFSQQSTGDLSAPGRNLLIFIHGFDNSFENAITRAAFNQHRRVAFPLAGVPLKLQWLRPKPYAETPDTLGGHLRKRRYSVGLTQAQVAHQLGANTWTYALWESDRTKPTVRFYPPIFRFLGYDPFRTATTLAERIAAQRRKLGLSIRAAAAKIGVDEGTFRRWESGEWKPAISEKAAEQFLALRTAPSESLQATGL